MAGQPEAGADANNKADPAQRQRSTIGFPYMDLKQAVELAEAIFTNVGPGECDDDQLAAWTKQSSKSSTFRVQIYAARMFGVLDGEGSRHKVTELGRSILDPNQARAAKARAFLNVPLYRAVFEKFKGGVLPPTAALEREFVALGVAEKQKDRARQAFERSAEQSGFFEHGKSRLVLPGFVDNGGNQPPPRDEGNSGGGPGGGNGSGGSGDDQDLDPVVAALIKKLPKKSTEFTTDARVRWLQMMEMAFQDAYGEADSIEIKKSGS